MQINENLVMTFPLYRGDDVYAYIHSAPVSREAFEAHYRLLTRTYSAVSQEGIAGTRVAHLLLRDAARDIAGDVASGDLLAKPLLNEIRRLSNVLLPTPAGWDSVPLQDAIDRNMLDAADVSEVMAAVIFFTAFWHVAPRAGLRELLTSGAKMWSALISSSPLSEFVASLPKSTATASSGVPQGITVTGR